VSERVEQLRRSFEAIYRERMRGLPIVNDRLTVEAIGFREFEGHQVGVLLTPWFMNLFLLAGNGEWEAAAPGDSVEVPLPGEACKFVVNHDAELGTCLSAILFRTVSDFPDQEMARAIAEDVLAQLFPADDAVPAAPAKVSRRSLLTGMEAG